MKLEDITLDDIYDFIENGGENVSEETLRYLELMDKIQGMHRRILEFGSKEIIIQHLMTAEGLSRFLANKVYNDTLEYFFCDNVISKDAWRNIYADRQDEEINMAVTLAKDVRDLKMISDMRKVAYEFRRLNQDDPPEIPAELLTRPFKLYSFDAKMLGLPTRANRRRVEEMIENLPELTEKERILIKQEALIEPLELFPEDHENARKSE